MHTATLSIHIIAGSLALISGFAALYASKGKPVHRRAGMVFVYTMLTMALAGFAIAIGRNVAPAINVPASLLTAYLVVTGLLTVRSGMHSRRFIIGGMLVALGVGVVNLRFAFEALENGGTRDGMPAFPFLMFGVVGVLAAGGDFRMLRSGALDGTARLARHLWRMCFALFIAALSFFLGQARVIPEPIRIPALLALPVLAVLLTMFYWMWRVRRGPRASRVPMRWTAAGSNTN